MIQSRGQGSSKKTVRIKIPLLENRAEGNKPADKVLSASQCNTRAGLLSNLILITADHRQTRQMRYGSDSLLVSTPFSSNLRNRITTDRMDF